MDITILADDILELKERKKMNECLDLARELKK